MPNNNLSKNSLKILERRYFLKDEEGNIIEDWDKCSDRVCNFVATAEKNKELRVHWYNEFYGLVNSLKFLPNSPCLVNAGNPNADPMLFACISGDTPIYTRNGIKRMDEVIPGDEVLTHMGRFKRVNNIWCNGSKHVMKLARGTKKRKRFSLTCTPDHKVLDVEEIWKSSETLTTAKLPEFNYNGYVPNKFGLSDLLIKAKGKDVEVDSDGYVRLLNYSDWSDEKYDIQENKVINIIDNDDVLAWLFGMYLAEGSIYGTYVKFTISSEEQEFTDRIQSIFKTKFGIDTSISDSSIGNWRDIVVSSRFIAELFRQNFNSGFDAKRIPEWAFGQTNSWIESLIDGLMDGDGTDIGESTRLVLANPTLIYQTVLLERKVGRHANFTSNMENKLSKNPTAGMLTSKSNLLHRPVKKTGFGPELVYDMEVEEDHSFVAGDFIVHNCFVLSIDDSMDSIFSTLKETALIHQAGGGTGFSFSKLRPKNSPVKKKAGVSSGPISFMKVFDAATEEIKQGGYRRGANMGTLLCVHPDIREFVDIKRNNKDLNNFNISVTITDEFMKAVEEGNMIELKHPRTGVAGQIKASTLWNRIITNAWKNGDPGVLFIDTMNRSNPIPDDPIESTNPCFGGDETILTSKGYRTFEELVDSDPEIINIEGQKVKAKIWHTGIKETVKVTFSSGESLICTPDQVFQVEITPVDNEICKAVDLKNKVLGRYDENLKHTGHAVVTNVESSGLKHVYDFAEPNTHWGYVSGFIVHNCGESMLNDSESCNLGSMNLTKYVTESNDIDYESLEKDVGTAIRFLDNMIDICSYPTKAIENKSKRRRKVGLGVMGLADLFIMLGIPYNSNKALQVADKLMEFINKVAFEASMALGKEKGAFPDFDKSVFADKKLPMKQRMLRNASRTCQAPTGSISIVAGVSSGIEPNFAFEYSRETSEKVNLDDVHPLYAKIAYDENGQPKEVSDRLSKIFVTAEEIDPEFHVRMQATIQKHIDMGCSKTINMPTSATRKQVKRVYELAYDLGCKGITIFRDKSKGGKQVIYNKNRRCPACKKYALESVEGCQTCRLCGYSACEIK